MEPDKPSETILAVDDNCATRTPEKASLENKRPGKYQFSAALVLLAIIVLASLTQGRKAAAEAKSTDPIMDNAARMLSEGRTTFRFETFGDEAFWGDTIKLHQSVAGSKLGGVGPGVSPKTALSVGLKVDVDALPQSIITGLKQGQVNLDDPATTLALLNLKAVVGVTGIFDTGGNLKSMGIQCAFCHSTVDDSFAPGIGHRLDGWPNRDLNVGAIVALAPDLSAVDSLLGVEDATVRKVLNSWGPGKYDAQLFIDGKAYRPDGTSGATLIPPAYGLAGVNMGTSTGYGSTTYWNAFVSNLEMHGKGTFYDARLNDPNQFPIAVKAGSWNVRNDPDMITAKLAALHFYQLAIPAPRSLEADNAFNFPAQRGKVIFSGKAQCAACHVPPLFTEPGYNMHSAAEMGIDDFQAKRSPTGLYRTAPLAGLFSRQKGGYFHDGRFATLSDVVNHYDSFRGLGLSDDEKADLVAYLRTL